jgi:hypothetical protein
MREPPEEISVCVVVNMRRSEIGWLRIAAC